jgi:hypothetical protein
MSLRIIPGLFVLLASLAVLQAAGDGREPAPLLNAHAHNDYRHPRPLLDALERGFTSVEADIFLIGGKLLVGHDLIELRAERTLEALYLEPLRRRVRENGGRVFRGGPPFLLLIDIKSDGEATYAALREVLQGYSEMLTAVRDGKEEVGAVSVVISGNRPWRAIAAEAVRHAAIDGRLGDLDSEEPSHLLPLISDHWGRNFQWRGDGPMPPEEREKLRAIVEKAHARGRRVRFWATPESPALWSELRAAGADLINTDDLDGLKRFLLAHAAASGAVELQPKSRAHFSTLEEARAILRSRDEFVARLSPFDRAVRVQSAAEVSEAEFLEFAAGEARAWEPEEAEKLAAVIRSAAAKLASFELPLPERVDLVKTSGREEAGAAYTRQAAVIFSEKVIERSPAALEDTFLHELFHVLSRRDGRLREALYSVIGFESCREIELPESLRERRITNPDAPRNDVLIRLEHGGETLAAAPLLFSKEARYDPAHGGELFSHLVFRLLVLEERDGIWVPSFERGSPRLLDPAAVPAFAEKIGRNTSYTIHPEEVLADNFVLLLKGRRDVPDPRILDAMERILRSRKP